MITLPLIFIAISRYAAILQSLSQELLQRIHHGQSTADSLEETTDLNDVDIFFYRGFFKNIFVVILE